MACLMSATHAMDDRSCPQSSSPNSMCLGCDVGLYFSPLSNLVASSLALCRILSAVGKAACSVSSGIPQGSVSSRSNFL
eukprot:8015691-Prorocentrum_lima.AAC.1